VLNYLIDHPTWTVREHLFIFESNQDVAGFESRRVAYVKAAQAVGHASSAPTPPD